MTAMTGGQQVPGGPGWTEAAASAAVGMIVPADFGQEAELRRWLPATASLHLARTGSAPSPSTAADAFAAAAPAVVRGAAAALPATGVLAFGCVPAAVAAGVEGERLLTGLLRDTGAPRALTGAGALAAACAALGVERVALVTPHAVTRYAPGGRAGAPRAVTPYVEPLTALLEGFLGAHGVACVARTGLGRTGPARGVTVGEIARRCGPPTGRRPKPSY